MALKLSDLQGEYEEIEAPKQGLAAGLGTFAKGVGVGALKSVGETALGIGQIGRGIQSRISGLAPSIFKTGDSIFDPERAEEIRQTTLAANAPGQGTGKFLGTVAQYMLPTSKIAKGQQILGAVASKVPTTGGAQLLAKGAARFLPEAAGTGAVAFTRSGGDLEQTKNEALIAGGFSVGLGVLGGIARSTYWPTLYDSVNKALGTQGKKSGGVALKQTAEKVSGLQVLKQRAPKLTVTLDDGTKAAFNPENASYGTTLQAWNEARKQIFDEYTAIAKKAGEKATLDLSVVRKQMAEALDAPVLSVEKNAVKSILNDFDSIFKDPTKVDMQTAERFVKSLNENTVNGFFAGTSDAASSKVYAGTSKLIRESMDDVIEETTGAQYQATRSQYAALKSLENDLVRKFQQDARQIGGGLPEYTGAFASGDIIGSALSLDPAQFAKGATIGIFSVLKRKLSNPERFLRRSFDLIDDVPSDLSLRLWGGVGELTDAEKQFAKEMIPEGPAMSQGGYVGNVPKGFPKGATPSTNPLEEAKKYKSAEEFVKAQGTPVYHGGNKVTDIKVSKDSFTGKPVGFSTTPDKAFAKRYSQQISRDGEVTELYLKPNAKILDKTEAGIDPHIDPTYSADANLIKDALAQGYDAVRMRVTAPGGLNEGTSIELQILNPDAVKTRTQLEDIWKKANTSSKVSSLEAEAPKYKSADMLSTSGGSQVSTSLANFIGKNAKTFDTEASFEALDGMVRNQINASLKMKPLFDDIVENRAAGNKSWAQFVPLRELIDYHELFTAYPTAKNIRVSFMDMGKKDFGSFYLDDRGVPTINLNRSKKDATQTLKHEIQHFIQAKEGFSLGGNPDVLFRADVQNQVLKQQLRNVIRDKEIYHNATIGDMEYIKSSIEKTGRGEKLTTKEIEDFFGSEEEFNDLAMKTYKHLHGEWEAEANSIEELLKVKSPIFGKSKK